MASDIYATLKDSVAVTTPPGDEIQKLVVMAVLVGWFSSRPRF